MSWTFITLVRVPVPVPGVLITITSPFWMIYLPVPVPVLPWYTCRVLLTTTTFYFTTYTTAVHDVNDDWGLGFLIFMQTDKVHYFTNNLEKWLEQFNQQNVTRINRAWYFSSNHGCHSTLWICCCICIANRSLLWYSRWDRLLCFWMYLYEYLMCSYSYFYSYGYSFIH